jgi:hypothetical protein
MTMPAKDALAGSPVQQPFIDLASTLSGVGQAPLGRRQVELLLAVAASLEEQLEDVDGRQRRLARDHAAGPADRPALTSATSRESSEPRTQPRA